MRRFHYHLRRFAAIVIGLVFFISGTLKLMDPVGAGLIVGQYLEFFHAGFLSGAAKGLGIALSLLEAITGTALVTGVYRRLSAIVSSCLTAFFTIVTFILWIAAPAFDCGCFGEALHLTHAQSLIKNLVLLALAALAFIPFRDYGRSRGGKKVPFYLVGASLVALVVYSDLNIPLRDFTPYNYHSRLLAAQMADPEGDSSDYITVYVYEKNGQEGSFAQGQLPDSTWTFVRSETIAKEDNYNATDFPDLEFTDAQGNFCNDLAAGEYVIVFSMPEPAKVRQEKWAEVAALLSDAEGSGFTPLLLVSSEPGSITSLLPAGLDAQARHTLETYCYYSSYKTLISLNRSNGGATYFNEGNLVRKWPARSLPGLGDFAGIHDSDTTELTISADSRGNLWFQAFFLYSIAVMFLL